MPKPKKKSAKKVSTKDMGKSRGGSTRNVSGVGVFADYSNSQSEDVLLITWILDGALPPDFSVYVYSSAAGAPFTRGENPFNNLPEVTDEPSDSFDATFVYPERPTVQTYAVCIDSRGELLAKSPIVTTVMT